MLLRFQFKIEIRTKCDEHISNVTRLRKRKSVNTRLDEDLYYYSIIFAMLLLDNTHENYSTFSLNIKDSNTFVIIFFFCLKILV